jgi:NAD+ kinase
MKLQRVGFAYNPTKEAALELRERAEGWCQMRGIAHWAAPAGELSALVEQLPETGVLVVLGGDGTFLRAARAVAEVDVPLLGVNLGKIGFLSKVETNGLEATLARLVEGDFKIEDRMALEATIHPGGRDEAGETFFALNEIAVARGAMARVWFDRVLVLRGWPDRRSVEPQPDRHADCRLPDRDPVGRREPAAHGPLPRRRRV